MYFTTGAQLQAALNALPTSKKGSFTAFDSFYYGQTYMTDYTGTLSPIEHFVQIGAARGFQPNSTFNPSYYANAYADLRGKGYDSADLLYHFMQYGLDEGRAPNSTLATFDAAAYLAANADVATYVNANLSQFGGSTANGALAHYVKFGSFEGRTATYVVTGSSFNLTTSVETVSGTAGGDTFIASTVPGSITLNDGDIINGYGGTDTLTLTAGGTSTPVAFLNSVETVNIRMLSSQSLDALGWSGTTTVEITNDSIDDKTLTVTNANQATTFKISDDANIAITYLDSTGSGDTAKLAVNAGGVSGSAAIFTIAGTEAVSLTASGTSYVQVSASDTALKDVVVTGSGALTLDVAETSLSGLSLAGFNGTTKVTLGAASNVNLTGGAGDDTFAFGTTFNGLDTVAGGNGTDTLTATVQGIIGFTKVSSVESATLTVAGTTVADANGASFSVLNVANIQGSSDLTLNNMGTVEINLASYSTAGNTVLDYTGGVVSNLDLVGSGAQTYSALSISDASGVDISNDGASATQVITELTLDADAKALVVASNSGATTVTGASGAGLTSLTISAGQSGTFSNTTFVGSALTGVSVTAAGASANATLGALSLNTGIHTITTTVNGGNASASIGNLTFGASGSETISLTSTGSGASVVGGTVTAGTAVMAITVGANGASSLAKVGNIVGANSGNTTISLSASGAAASAAIGTFTGGTAAATTITLNLAADANASVGNVVIGASAATLAVAVAAAASSDVTFGSITVGSADAATATTLDIGFSLGSGDLTLATAQATTINSISGVAGNNATATITAVSANAVTGISLGGSGSLQIGTILASASVGTISVTTGTFSASVVAPTIGAITVEGDGFTLAASASKSIGNIVVGGSNSGAVSITNANLSASFGTITLAGTGTVTIDLGNATGVGAISTVSMTGEFNLDAGSATGQVIAALGGATGIVTVSLAGSKAGVLNGDIYTLSSGTGSNYFRFQSTANNDITIQNFQVGTGVDRLYFGTAGFDLGQGTAGSIAASAAGALGVAFVTGASATISNATQVIVLATGTYADASAVAVALTSTYTAQAATATTAGLDFIVVWADTAGDTHVSVVDLAASAAQGGVLFTAVAGTNFTDLAVLDDTGLSLFSGGTQFYSY